MGSRRTPVPGVDLEGYATQVSLAPGESTSFMASGSPGPAGFSIARLVHGDPNPAGPGYKDEEVDWGTAAAVDVDAQELDLGSFVEIPDADSLTPPGSLTLALWIRPTLLNGEWQAVAAKWVAGALSYGIFATGHNMLVGALSFDGVTANWLTAAEQLVPHDWQFVALTFEAASGTAVLWQSMNGRASSLQRTAVGLASTALASSPKTLVPGRVSRSHAPLLFGALAESPRSHWAHFNGKLAAPLLMRGAADESELRDLLAGNLAPYEDRLLGRWDFSRQVSSSSVVDTSRFENDGRAVNLPARSVTGPHWMGTPGSVYSDDPSVYDAVHLHDDDLADADWQETVSVLVPDGARPGIYAAKVERPGDTLFLPFVVRSGEPTQQLCLLIPTLTWLAYSTNRAAHSHTEDGLLDRGVCLYDAHSDGSQPLYATWRRPTRSGNPREATRVWGAHNVTSDLYLIDWLDHHGVAYDVCSDHDLDRLGVDLLEPFRCIILGSHPEYWTGAMLDALDGYLRGGGRVVYLGGNGLYWVTSVDPERPYIMEVRKSGDGEHEPWRTDPGQAEHSTTGEIGGLWERRGRPPRRYVGVEHAGNVFTPAEGRRGFARTPASLEPEYEFIFSGVEEEVIGRFGLNLGSAAGYETDAVQEWSWPDGSDPVILASAHHESFMPTLRKPTGIGCDMTLRVVPGGGAVFAAGSVTWTGSLSHSGYRNDVSRITHNVVSRFLAVPDKADVRSVMTA